MNGLSIHGAILGYTAPKASNHLIKNTNYRTPGDILLESLSHTGLLEVKISLPKPKRGPSPLDALSPVKVKTITPKGIK